MSHQHRKLFSGFPPNPNRGQAAVEFVLVAAAVVAIVVAVAFTNVRSAELSVAFAAARTACVEWSSKNSSIAFTSIDYRSDGNVTFVPNVYSLGSSSRITDAPSLERAVIERLRDTFAPGSNVTELQRCFTASYNTYCVSLS
jgi:hypothetical protein